MKNAFSLFLCLIFAALLAMSQKAENLMKMDRATAAQAWASVSSMPTDTPGITGGGLVVESESNGSGRKVWLEATQSGQYLLQGKTCDGDVTRLGEFWFEANNLPTVGNSAGFLGLVFDSGAMGAATPFAPQICSVEAIRIDKGTKELSSVWIEPWWGNPPSVQVTGEGVIGEKYAITVASAIPADAIMILGRQTLAEKIQRLQTGANIITFPAVNMPPLGPTTLTICSKGQCVTTTFDRKVAQSSGKG